MPDRPSSAAPSLGRPSTAGSLRPSTAAPAKVLDLKELLKEEHHHALGKWWCSISVIQRARGRWVFHEPEGLPFPRQRARNEILDEATLGVALEDLQLPMDANEGVERHNICQWAPDIKGEPLQAWKSFALKSTNQVFQKVPEPDPMFGPGIWLRVMRKSHGAMLKPGGLEMIHAWSATSSQKQRSALSELLWSFSSFLTSLRGRSETKLAYGPKVPEIVHVSITNPFESSLGRPSSAPIASAVQLKAEKKRRDQAVAQSELAAQLKKDRMALKELQMRGGFVKPSVDTLTSQVPFGMAGADILPLESTAQAQMRSVKPAHLAMAIKWNRPAFNACPPATSGMGRCLGEPQYHGDAMYTTEWPTADMMTSRTKVDALRRPWQIKGPAAAWDALDRRKMHPR
jgi:hypothetical protein